MWYVRAADQGDDRAKTRIAAIRAAASGDSTIPVQQMPISPKRKANKKKKMVAAEVAKTGEQLVEEKGKAKRWGIF